MDLDLLRKYAPQLNLIAKKHGISKLYVFGSVARGESTPKSGVDFLVEMMPNAPLFGAAGFSYEAEKILQTKVDIFPSSVMVDLGNDGFVANIRREAVII
jgi:predicted nucleotidyltransferase